MKHLMYSTNHDDTETPPRTPYDPLDPSESPSNPVPLPPDSEPAPPAPVREPDVPVPITDPEPPQPTRLRSALREF